MLEQAADAARAYVLTRPGGDEDEGLIPIDFIFFGDLLDAILSPPQLAASERASAGPPSAGAGQLFEDNQIRPILGSFHYRDPRTGEVSLIELADIPISLELFATWFLHEFIKPQRTVYTFNNFVKNSFQRLIADSMAGCLYSENLGGEERLLEQRNMRLNNHIFSKRREEELLAPNSRLVEDDIPIDIAHVPFNLANEDFVHYDIFAVDTQNAEFIQRRDISRPEQVEEDINDGIFHFAIGADRGILKRVDFERQDIPYLTEARYLRGGSSTLDHYREIYNVNLDLFGNTIFSPGGIFFLDPSLVGLRGPESIYSRESMAYQLGLGGYFMIIEIEHEMEFASPVSFSTRLYAIWQDSGLGIQSSEWEDQDCVDSVRTGNRQERSNGQKA